MIYNCSTRGLATGGVYSEDAVGAAGHARGSVMVKVVPWPTTLSTVICPPCAATMSYTLYTPQPVPLGLGVYKDAKISRTGEHVC
jgi:hypothetical protein